LLRQCLQFTNIVFGPLATLRFLGHDTSIPDFGSLARVLTTQQSTEW
jgi:hypothetical protein